MAPTRRHDAAAAIYNLVYHTHGCLMLEDINKLFKFKSIVEKAKGLITFIYDTTGLLF